ncbi:MAG: nicotinate (nicotinamide) nucleotide adenylyltransferase [Candidatus Obscuribacter sp.]|nr:nicotinate (nicotinamide) nucleotide adenylyltransferase [Candidatus Obscuribacter sp.]MBK9770508.1 nicotinate (nicotinamide) nucleotide adenylyltransferase [Candidatus Obscuribacter sp.]
MDEIGLFCGTFNPIHIGHLLIAEAAREQFNLDKVLFVLSPQPPHRSGGLLASEDRYKLVQAACESNPHFEPSRLELDRPGPSYTVDTAIDVQKLYPQSRINLIIGGDNLPFLKEWHNIQTLLKMVRLLVIPRLRLVDDKTSTSGISDRIGELQMDTSLARDLDASVLLEAVDFPGIGISASGIRSRLSANLSVLYMVPESVNKIILQNGFYKTTGTVGRAVDK